MAERASGAFAEAHMLLTAKPSPDLASRVEMVWSLRSEGGSGTAFHEFFPDSSANLILRCSAAGCRLVLLGPVTEKASVELDEAAEYFGVRFRPGEVPRLADLRASELTNAHVELTACRGVRLDDLAERLSSLRDMQSRQLVMEDLVRGAPPLVRDERCRRAAMLVEDLRGRLRVEDLAAALGLHVRSLERLCLDQLGMPPKRLIRLVRLREVLVRLHAGNFASLADLALECGYSDQPHMIRDFKELTGRLPGEKDAFLTRRMTGAPRTAVVHRYRPGAPASRR